MIPQFGVILRSPAVAGRREDPVRFTIYLRDFSAPIRRFEKRHPYAASCVVVSLASASLMFNLCYPAAEQTP